jgi:hypothetical protein
MTVSALPLHTTGKDIDYLQVHSRACQLRPRLKIQLREKHLAQEPALSSKSRMTLHPQCLKKSSSTHSILMAMSVSILGFKSCFGYADLLAEAHREQARTNAVPTAKSAESEESEKNKSYVRGYNGK